jgi:Ni/Co efflux regulator RcnB
MHRARHTAHSPAFRPRLLIALLVAGVGLTFALWLPTRNDSASATENGRPASQAQGDHRRDRDWDHHRDHDRTHDRSHDRNHDRDHRRDRRRESPSAAPSPADSAASPSPSASARSESPSGTPTSEQPRATEWAPFTDYVAGQLVTFKGVEYQVRETHTALPGWAPNVLPALFKPLD